jgi:hypothetical protein
VSEFPTEVRIRVVELIPKRLRLPSRSERSVSDFSSGIAMEDVGRVPSPFGGGQDEHPEKAAFQVRQRQIRDWKKRVGGHDPH